MRIFRSFSILLLFLILLCSCKADVIHDMSEEIISTSYSNPFVTPTRGPNDYHYYPKYEGEVNSLKEIRTFDEITDVCIEAIDCQVNSAMDGIHEGSYVPLLQYDEDFPTYDVIPEETYHIIRNYYEPDEQYYFCHEFDSLEAAEANFRQYVYELIEWSDHIHCTYIDNVLEGYCIMHSNESLIAVYLSNECVCYMNVYLDVHIEKLPNYYRICQELCWPYFDIETETMVYPEDLEDIDTNSISEEIAEPDDMTVQEETNEESRFLDDIST